MFKTETVINQDYKSLTGFIESIPEHYDSIGKVIYSDRNELKVVEYNGLSLVVKNFKKISPINKLSFFIFRVTKAKNAYKHSVLLLKRGINTPAPIGYIDCFKNGFINKSFFVSLFTEFNSLETILKQPIEDSAPILKALGKFTFQLHIKGIFPGDYNKSNIRFKVTEKGYLFEIIDINRMNVSRFTFKKGAKNLRRLEITADKLGVIATEYARQANEDDIKTLHLFTGYRLDFAAKRRLRKQLKKIFTVNKKIK